MRRQPKQANRIAERAFVRYDTDEYKKLKAEGWVEGYRYAKAPLVGISEAWSEMIRFERIT